MTVVASLMIAPTVRAESLAVRQVPGAPGRSDGVTPGVPEGGPSVLYEPPPAVPQVENHDRRFRAPYELVSGTERYVDGEYLYTDFLYDDDAVTYPDDFDRFGNNAADLVEFRMSTRGNDLAARLSLTTLLAPDSTVAVVAFDSDRDDSTGGDNLPRDPGLPFPGTDHVLTTWGTGAEWSTWNGTGWDTVSLESVPDVDANQITVTIPTTVARPTGQWTATLATGLFDGTTGGWLAVESTHGSDIVNLGFRLDDMEPGTHPDAGQNSALSAGTPTTYAHVLDFDLLRDRAEYDDVPANGLIYRMFASHLETVDVVTEPSTGVYERTPASEGKDRSSLGAQYLSRLQPYAVHVPDSYDPADPMPMTLALHGLDADYHWINDIDPLTRQLGDDRDSIVLSPGARSRGGFYIGEMEFDVFEAWNDAARHYAFDPARTAITGLSMGGYGTYRIGLLYPHLFSRAIAIIPAGKSGIWIPGVTDDRTMVNQWLENARNLPIFHIGDTASELTFYPGQHQNTAGPETDEYQSLDSLGYRYKLWALAADHALAIALYDYPDTTGFLADHQVEPEPFRVTYSRMPSNESPDLGLLHDRAYWVSDIELRDDADGERPVAELPSGIGPDAALAKGSVDAISLGFGLSDPTSSLSQRPGVTPSGLAYVEQERTWSEPGKVPVENRIVLRTTNVESLTIDPVGARVDCDVELDVISDAPIDEPIEVNLLGCAGQRDGAIDPARGQGHVDHHHYEPTGTNDVLVYVPQDWQPSDQLPLYVMVHGCGTTAYQQMQANLLNPIADRERFLVAYPDNGGQCWRAVSDDVLLEPATGPQSNSTRGGGGDADIIAGITRQVIDRYNVDTERVYMVGMSSGAFQASATAAAYPEIYAAVGVAAGGGYGMSVACVGYPEAVVPAYAQATVEQMGERARVMPFFSIGGDQDPLGEMSAATASGCSRLAYLEWLYANNLVQPGDGLLPAGAGVLLPPGTTGDTYQHDPNSTDEGQVPDGHAWTKHVARGPDGCQIAERWIVHGMSHYWSGGTTDPMYTDEQENGPGFNDPKGPSASQASWDFFEQFTLSGGNTACPAA